MDHTQFKVIYKEKIRARQNRNELKAMKTNEKRSITTILNLKRSRSHLCRIIYLISEAEIQSPPRLILRLR